MHRFITDASDVVRKVGKRILSELDFQVSEASNASEALCRCGAEMPDYVIVDLGLDGALDLISAIRAMDAQSKSRSTTASSRSISRMMAKRAGATDFLLKPFDRKILMAVFGDRAIAA